MLASARPDPLSRALETRVNSRKWGSRPLAEDLCAQLAVAGCQGRRDLLWAGPVAGLPPQPRARLVESLTTSVLRMVATIRFSLTGATAVQVPSGTTGRQFDPGELGREQLPQPGLHGGDASRVGCRRAGRTCRAAKRRITVGGALPGLPVPETQRSAAFADRWVAGLVSAPHGKPAGMARQNPVRGQVFAGWHLATVRRPRGPAGKTVFGSPHTPIPLPGRGRTATAKSEK